MAVATGFLRPNQHWDFHIVSKAEKLEEGSKKTLSVPEVVESKNHDKQKETYSSMLWAKKYPKTSKQKDMDVKNNKTHIG